ncbi:MAG TPA: peptidase S8 [Herpetosiphon sp.]|uniref:Peptidase S8 and S53 subtilisin kexin sedolisin n=1 Tax=Herpetosiphon aurantiacus (strain ATCC 23779 / DSM 785 / 114-95) TaxID=316274 RepID=A9AZ10_HERA2|nr:carboxypeptidase regulatory-like domain-containing protein [Herpetosiphon sp.]ABX07050.1 peptidase S8 and S53 subtilisin kexin sedolisin [Herpetosiphon aurantiacus DSM 785]HBW52641.1 peptidase S8 [Herpetosiphon sp.]
MARFSLVRQLVLALMLVGLALPAGQPSAAQTSANPQTFSKLLIDTGSSASRFAQTHGKLLVDYGAFGLWQIADNQLNQVKQLAGATTNDLDTLNFRGIRFNPLKAQPSLRLTQSPTAEHQLWLVQFIGPIKDTWLEQLTKAGAELVIYVPSNSYLVWADGASLNKLNQLQQTSHAIQWMGVYQPEYRLAPELRTKASSPKRTELVDVSVQIYNAGDIQASVDAVIAASSKLHARPWQVLNFTTLSVQLPETELAALAQRANIYNIEPWSEPELFDERQGQIIAGNVTTLNGKTVPSGPGYLSWLQSQGLPNNPAEYPIVDVVDDGFDDGTINPLHPDFYLNGVRPGTSRITATSNCTLDPRGNSLAGHGQINAGIIGGYNNLTGFPYIDEASSGIAGGYNIGLGIAPYTRMSSTKIFRNSGSFSISNCDGGDSYADIVTAGYEHQAAITSNSWGQPGSMGAYNIYSQLYDQLTRDASSDDAGNQAMLHIFAAGNMGEFGANTVSAPSTAKNVISVGATENVRDEGVLDGNGCEISQADNADDLAVFSGKGPTDDSRIKPDIMAPGTHVIGPAPQESGFLGAGVCGGLTNPYYPDNQTLYTWSSGTSHSAPAVSGAASLLYTKYRTSFGNGATPSPAMLKAYLLASSRYLDGVNTGGNLPTNQQGWGDVYLKTALDSTPRIVVDQSHVFGASGESFSQVGQIADSNKALRVALTWTDAAGGTTGDAFVNDLDLEVTVGGQVYKGNVFNETLSTTGGVADAKNNVESVYLPAGASGAIQVRVIARNIAGDAIPGNADTTDQDFALYVYNASQGAIGTVTGRVSNASNAPVANVRIATSNNLSTVSDANGNYRLVLPVGTYALTASINGVFQSVPALTIGQNAQISQNFTLVYGSISGVVRDSFTPSLPIGGALVSTAGFSTFTDSSGAYQIPVAAPGTVALNVQADRYTPQQQNLNVVANTTTTGNFNLAAGAVEGMISDASSGLGVKDAVVTLDSYTVKTNAAGYYSLRLPLGSYSVGASKVGLIAETQNLTLSNGLTSTLNLSLIPLLSYTPSSLSQSFEFGAAPISDSLSLELTNNTTQPISYSLRELSDAGFTPARNQQRILVVLRTGSDDANAVTIPLSQLGYAYDQIEFGEFATMSLADIQAYDAVMYLGTTDTAANNPQEAKLAEYLDAGGRLLIADNDLGFFTRTGSFYQQYLDASFGSDDPNTANYNLIGLDFMAGINPMVVDFSPDYFAPGSSSRAIFRYSDGSVGGSYIERNGYKAIYLAVDFRNFGTGAFGERIERDIVEVSLAQLLGTTDQINWVELAPLRGEVAAGQNSSVAVSWFPDRLTQPGTYTGTVVLAQTAVYTQTAEIPISITITPNTSQARLSGVVTGSGVCSNTPAPLANVLVTINDQQGLVTSVRTNSAGEYVVFVPTGDEYSLEFSATDHVASSQSITVADGEPSVNNVQLRLDKGCLIVGPHAINTNVVFGESKTEQLFVISTGAQALDVAISETRAKTVNSGDLTLTEVDYNWIEASDGTNLNMGAYDLVNIVTPFPINLYGVSTTDLRISNNGVMILNNLTGLIEIFNPSLENAIHNYVIAPYWDDLDDETGGVYWKVVGEAPNRAVVVQWENRPHYNFWDNTTFQAVLSEQGDILFQYKDVDFNEPFLDFGASATIGVRGTRSEIAQYSVDQPVLRDRMALCISQTCDSLNWLSVSPNKLSNLTGTPSSFQTVDLAIDTSNFETVGVYTTNLVLNHTTPQPPVVVPVTVNVTLPEGYGVLNGLVETTLVCDVNPMPLANVKITIDTEPPTVLYTNNVGNYSRPIPAGSYNVLVEGYPGAFTSVSYQLTVEAGQTYQQDSLLRLKAPCLDTSSTPAITTTTELNMPITASFSLSNIGAGVLDWQIEERLPQQKALAANAQRVTTSQTEAQPQLVPASERLLDGGFEATTISDNVATNPYWSQDSRNFASLLCTVECDDIMPHTGDWFIWMGGIGSNFGTETSYFSQDFSQTSFSAGTLSFWLSVTAPMDRPDDYMRVLINNNEVFRVTNADRANYGSYTLVTVPINEQVLGGRELHSIRFEAQIVQGGNTNFFIDDLSLDLIQSCAGDAVDWLHVEPTRGSIAADSEQTIDVAFDPTGLAVGTHTASLCLITNNPNRQNVRIPVSLTVEPAAIPNYPLYLPMIMRN